MTGDIRPTDFMTEMNFQETSLDSEKPLETTRFDRFSYESLMCWVLKPLIWSCRYRLMNRVKWMVEHAENDVNYRGLLGTPLSSACFNDHLDIVKYLVET